MAAFLAPTDVDLRPHAKTHKSPAIANLQIARGAVGVCCQTIGEAETMFVAGINDILVTNQIVDPDKLDRLAALARFGRVGVLVDHPIQVDGLARAAARHGVEIHVFVEIDVGSKRSGVPPGQAAVDLAQRVTATPLRFAGLHAYHGKPQGIRGTVERRVSVDAAAEQIGATKGLFLKTGLSCPCVTGGGTGTLVIDVETGVFTEVQAGSYVFLDGDYMKNEPAGPQPLQTFENSLFVVATVISRPTETCAVIDAGLKALAVDCGPPLVVNQPEIVYHGPNDEHGCLSIPAGHPGVGIGERVRLIPGHCDPTVNLYDWYVGVRGNRVEALWLVAGRGAH